MRDTGLCRIFCARWEWAGAGRVERCLAVGPAGDGIAPGGSVGWAALGRPARGGTRWLGLVSQGGLAVTVAAVFRRAFPEWNVSLEALLVAMIGVHQLIGPVCLR